MTDHVLDFLESLNIAKYHEIFKIKGYDTASDLIYLTSSDLDNLDITDEEDRATILNGARTFTLPDKSRLEDWLRENGLDYYLENFLSNEYIRLEDIQNLQIDEHLYDELEILLPGHRRRLERAINKLRKRHRSSETPVAYGYWAKPSSIGGATHDFLCLQAKIKSTINPETHHDLEFLVDSGSDVVTIKEELLQQMNLEPIGMIQSHGIHASKEKQMYKASLHIGRVKLDVEVIGGTFESIGIRVIRNFRHFIGPVDHFWLQKMVESPSESASATGESTSSSFNLITFP